MKKIDFNLNLLEKNMRLGVAVSGGADSMCLLSLLLKKQKEFNYYLIVIHVEHGIRGASSLRDKEFVVNYCQKNKIPFTVYTVTTKNYAQEHKISLETAARVLRYQKFAEAFQELNLDKIALGHHLNDQAETVLLNILRGSGITGIGGMLPENKNFIRPLLNTSKETIVNYLKIKNIAWCNDETNTEQKYTRNFIRESLLPLIKIKFPNAVNALGRLATIAQEENIFLDSLAERNLVYLQDNLIKIDTNLSIVILKRAIIKALKQYGITQDWNYQQLQMFLKAKSKIKLFKNDIYYYWENNFLYIGNRLSLEKLISTKKVNK